MDTTSSGAKSGTATLNYQTAGTVGGVSNGLGTASVGNQLVTVNGNVYQAATGAIQSAPLNFGTVQVGQSVSQNLVIRNTATGANGFVEDLNDGIARVAKALGRSAKPVVPRLNVHSARRRLEDLRAEERDAIEAVTRLDQRLYRRLWEHWRHRDPGGAGGGTPC